MDNVLTPVENRPPQSLWQRLDSGEQHWIWKLGMRAFLVVVGFICIGCMGWAVSTKSDGPYARQLDDRYSIIWTLMTSGTSVIWCSICILVLLLRRPNAPIHPGVAVGIDLILWLAFIATALFALVGALSVLDFGEDGIIGRYSPYGYYFQANNGTWVWNATEYDTYFQVKRDCTMDGQYSKRYNGYGFDTCAEEDAYVNSLWNSKSHRARVEVTGVVCQFLGLVLHFALFVWACVDTNRRNSRKTSKDAEVLAANIVMAMIKDGRIVQNPPSMQQHQHQQQPRPSQPSAIQNTYWMGPMPPQVNSPYNNGGPRGEKVDQIPRYA